MSLSLFLAWPGRAGDTSVVLPGDGASWSCVLTGDCFSCPAVLACGDETGWILAGLPGDDCCCVLGGDWLGKLTVVGIEGFGYVLVTVVTTHCGSSWLSGEVPRLSLSHSSAWN